MMNLETRVKPKNSLFYNLQVHSFTHLLYV